jgi:hypothetical protein
MKMADTDHDHFKLTKYGFWHNLGLSDQHLHRYDHPDGWQVTWSPDHGDRPYRLRFEPIQGSLPDNYGSFASPAEVHIATKGECEFPFPTRSLRRWQR